MAKPIRRFVNGPYTGWSTNNSRFAQPQGPQSLPYSLAPYGVTIAPGIHNTCVNDSITELPLNEIQTSFNGPTNKVVDFSHTSSVSMPIQQLRTPPAIDLEDYRSYFSWNSDSPGTENHYQTYDTGNKPDVPHLDGGYPGSKAVPEENNGTLGTKFPFSVSNEEFTQNFGPDSASWPSFNAIPQPWPEFGEPYSEQFSWAQPIFYCTATLPFNLVFGWIALIIPAPEHGEKMSFL